jgi:hypothetical protein
VNSTATVSWTATTGSITSGGVYTAPTTSGSATITATSGSASGTSSVTLSPAAPASVTVSPSSASVTAGGTQSFTATIRDAYSNVNATASVTWSTNGGSITSGGVLTAQTTAATGKTVTATYNATVSGTASVTVVAGAISSITVTPGSATVLTNSVTTFSAQGYDQYGNAISGLTYAWSTTSGSITSAGALTAPSATGSLTVTASNGGRSGTSSVTVNRDVHVHAMATYKAGVAASTYGFGEIVETRVTVRDHNGTAVSGATVRLVLTDPNGVQQWNVTATTNAGGIAFINYTIPAGSKKGTWTDEVMALSGTNMVYDQAANVVRSITFTVS